MEESSGWDDIRFAVGSMIVLPLQEKGYKTIILVQMKDNQGGDEGMSVISERVKK
jgi:hypothetical protein